MTPLVGSLLTPQSYFCPHRLVWPGAYSCSPQFLESQLSGVDSSDAKMPKDEHSSDPGCGVTFERASWQPFYAPIGGTFFHSTWHSTIIATGVQPCCFPRLLRFHPDRPTDGFTNWAQAVKKPCGAWADGRREKFLACMRVGC